MQTIEQAVDDGESERERERAQRPGGLIGTARGMSMSMANVNIDANLVVVKACCHHTLNWWQYVWHIQRISLSRSLGSRGS